MDDAVEPFRQDNSRLIIENNDLHKSLLDIRDLVTTYLYVYMSHYKDYR